jgi:acetyl-CoA carboxylase biotin carboxyl carrier protein
VITPTSKKRTSNVASKKKSSAPAAKSNSNGDLARLEQVLELMGRHDIAELEWEKSGERFHLKKPSAIVGPSSQFIHAPQQAQHQHVLHPTPTAPPLTAPQAPIAPPTNQKQVVSPFVGTFYRSSSPTSEPYVKEGSAVKKGDALCIIEAMKLMNEIEAEFSGKVLSCLVENGQPVEFGEPLFLIEI